MYESNLCPAVDRHGRDCMKPRFPDAPGDLCAEHLRKAHDFWQEVEAIERRRVTGSDLPLPVQEKMAVNQAEQDISRKQFADAHDPPVVYYIRFRDRIKIGTTVGMRRRMAAIPHEEVLATEPGSYDLERQRHREFENLRVIGTEWFIPGPPLIRHIEGLRGSAL